MDKNFLELFGNILIGTARGKKQMDDMITWIQKSISSAPRLDELPSLFKKIYGLDHLSEKSTEYKQMAEEAVQDFQHSLKEYITILGMIPKDEQMVSRDEYLALIRKYEKLKEKCADQEETIKHLKMLVNFKEEPPQDLIGGLQDIVKGQTEIFQKMMKGVGQYLTNKNETEKIINKTDQINS